MVFIELGIIGNILLYVGVAILCAIIVTSRTFVFYGKRDFYIDLLMTCLVLLTMASIVFAVYTPNNFRRRTLRNPEYYTKDRIIIQDWDFVNDGIEYTDETGTRVYIPNVYTRDVTYPINKSKAILYIYTVKDNYKDIDGFDHTTFELKAKSYLVKKEVNR